MMLKLAILHLYLTQKGQDLICGKSSADKDVGYKTIKVSSIFLKYLVTSIILIYKSILNIDKLISC